MDSQPNNKSVGNDQKATQLLAACSSGNLPTLQLLLEGTDLELHAGKYFYPEMRPDFEESELPGVDELLTTAVIFKQATVVKFLLQKYPSYSMLEPFGMIRAILDNPDADTVQAFCDFDPRFPSTSIDYSFRCFITDACARPPEKIVSALHVLLDNGADVNDSWGPYGGALYAALLGSQPKEIIDKIVKKGAWFGFRVLDMAIEKERLDVLENLLRSSTERIEDEERLVESAKKTGNDKVIAVVEELVRDKELELGKLEQKRKSGRWWQVLGPKR